MPLMSNLNFRKCIYPVENYGVIKNSILNEHLEKQKNTCDVFLNTKFCTYYDLNYLKYIYIHRHILHIHRYILNKFFRKIKLGPYCTVQVVCTSHQQHSLQWLYLFHNNTELLVLCTSVYPVLSTVIDPYNILNKCLLN